MSDKINPEHYKRLPAEAIEIIESAIDNAPSNQDAYLHGQALKYLLRCWNKNGIEDLRKAKWYLDRLIQSFDDEEKQPVIKQSLTTEPDPGEGYRLLSKDPLEKLLDTDEWLFACGLDGQQWLAVNYSSGEQLPSVYYRRKIDVKTLKQSPQPPDGWRWLSVGEKILDGDKFLRNNDWLDCRFSVGDKIKKDEMSTIRRNRFEVGEKVVECVNNKIGVVNDIEAIGSGKNFLCHVEMQDTKGVIVFSPNQLAPYIEETT